MSLEQAFARALADHPESRLAVRVKKSMLAQRARSAPEARVAPHYDSASVHANIRTLLSAAS